MTKVSVIVPVYNVEEYLAKCLDSLVKQTLKDIEIIIVNDGSKDNSQKIIDKYKEKYKNIRSYTKKNGGQSSARNYGIKKAKGEYITFVDSDDYIDKSMLKKMYQLAIKEDLDIVVCDTIEIYGDKQILKKSNLNYSDSVVKNFIISSPSPCNKIYKNTLIDKLIFAEGIYYEDLNLIPSLALYTDKIGFLEEGLYYYIQRSGSTMHQNEYNEKLLDIFTVLNNNKTKLINKYPDEIEYMYITHLLRTATLRFLTYNQSKMLLDKVVKEMNTSFPNYKNNIYYKKSSIKLRIICFLAYHKKFNIIRLLKKVSGV